MTAVLDRLTAALADRYRIERELGHGGMATVYLAQDLRHHRRVAVKVLRPELAAALGPERFAREIEVAARLQHPHILALHDSGEADGFFYYVMPYVEGESLRDRLNRERQLPLDDALQITREVADALAYAHSHDVVHRDIKPENILLESGHAVVADFGIARAITAAGGEKLTETGIAVGTPAYMSPEQAAGERDVDGRSDLYSLGCVLYEMLAGHPPFAGTSAHELLARHAMDPVPPLRSARGMVPDPVENAIERVLAKAPADRFVTAAEFGQALTVDATALRRSRRLNRRVRRVGLGAGVVAGAAAIVAGLWMVRTRGGAAAVDPDVIAVMPLRVTGPDSSVRYLREGVLDILYVKLQGGGGPRALDARLVLNHLNRLVGKDGDPSPEEALGLARRLGAGRVLLGVAVATPAELLINARLLRVPDGQVVAEQTASRRGPESELQVLDRVLGALLAGAAGERVERIGYLSDSLRAVQAYLAGMHAARRQEYVAANRELTRALDIDPGFAVAALRRVQIAEGFLDAGLVRIANDEAWALRDRLSARDRAVLTAQLGPRYPHASTDAEQLAAVERAIGFVPDDASTWQSLGLVRSHRGRDLDDATLLKQAASAYDSAIALDPSSADALEAAVLLGIEEGDTARVRRLQQAWIAANPTGEYVDATRWLNATALQDTGSLGVLRSRFDQIHPWGIHQLVDASIAYGLPIEGFLELLERRDARQGGSLASYRLQLAMVEGRVAMAVALADSLRAMRAIVQQAITDPGYDEPAVAAGNWLRAVADTAQAPDPLCWSTIWRVYRSDTVGARAAIGRIRVLVGDRDNLPGPRVSRFDMCPRLLEAMLEQAPPHPHSFAALDRVDSLTRQGLANALPANIAGLMIARWRERQGDYRSARAALRPHRTTWNPPYMTALPGNLREEGRLAALAGDTAGAIRAYSRYLDLRAHPDPGPMAEEVRRVREGLAQLIAEQPKAAMR